MKRSLLARKVGPWPFGRPIADNVRTPTNPWKAGDRVRYHPTIGDADDGNEYVVQSIGLLMNQPIVWLAGKAGCIGIESLSSASEPRQPTAADKFAAAREAWRMKLDAQATISRLRKYRGLSASMKLDRDRALTRLAEAEATLQRVLGGSA